MILPSMGYDELTKWAHDLRKNIKAVFITTNGCFDIFHAGHASLLEWCGRKAQEKIQRPIYAGCTPIVVVLVNTDESVARIKPGRPLLPYGFRAKVVDGNKHVQYVMPLDEQTPCDMLACIRPILHVKDIEYVNKPMPERETVEMWNGMIGFCPRKYEISTTKIMGYLRGAQVSSGNVPEDEQQTGKVG